MIWRKCRCLTKNFIIIIHGFNFLYAGDRCAKVLCVFWVMPRGLTPFLPLSQMCSATKLWHWVKRCSVVLSQWLSVSLSDSCNYFGNNIWKIQTLVEPDHLLCSLIKQLFILSSWPHQCACFVFVTINQQIYKNPKLVVNQMVNCHRKNPWWSKLIGFMTLCVASSN